MTFSSWSTNNWARSGGTAPLKMPAGTSTEAATASDEANGASPQEASPEGDEKEDDHGS